MGDRYLTDLADVVRSAGLVVAEMEGWQSRARGSGGYSDGKPDHVMTHHTASGPSSDGWPDANYITYGDDDAPLANLYLARDGIVFVCAAGATNTNGSGDCPHLPPDTMNTSAVGIEAGNDGVGEPWRQVQQDVYTRLVAVLCHTYNIPHDHVESHAEWAPSRKIDPAGPSRWAESGTWDMDAFRQDVAGSAGMPAPPAPPPELEDVMNNLVCRSDDGVPWVISADLSWRMAVNETILEQLLDIGGYRTVHLDATLQNAIPTIDLPYPFEWDSTTMILADIASGETDTADVFFLIAVILFVVYAVIGFATAIDARIHSVLLGIGLACVALALLVL